MNWNRSEIDGDVDDSCFFSPLNKGLCNHIPGRKENGMKEKILFLKFHKE